MDFFSETIIGCDIKVGRCCQLNADMRLMSTKGQGHWFKSFRFNIFKLLFLNNH